MTISISPEVHAVLARSVVTESSLKLPDEQLDRKLYVDVNKVIEAAGGKWDRKSRSHIFSADPRSKLGLALETGKIVSKKADLQAFYTPSGLAERMADIALAEHRRPPAQLSVLEPSAGAGALLRPLVTRGVRVPHITCLDIDPDAVESLRASGFKAKLLDFAATQEPSLLCAFDLVVMNPPFTKGQAVAHVSKALRCVNVGGVVVSVMPQAWQTARSNVTKALLLALEQSFDWRVEPIEDFAFRESGTDVRTNLLIAKWKVPQASRRG